MWFSTILMNAFKDWKRAESAYSDYAHDDEDDERDSSELVCQNVAIYTMKEIMEEVYQSQGAKCEVLTLHYEHGHNATDIARITEHSYAQCHKIINRFQHYLRTKYV